MKRQDGTRFPKESRHIISLGFGVILTLSLAIYLTGYTRLTSLKQDIDTISNLHHQKVDLVNELQQIVSQRSLAMHNMRGMDDMFDIDEEYLRYKELAGQFIDRREKFQSLPLFDDEERLFSNLLKLIKTAQPHQDEVVNAFIIGDHRDVTQLDFDIDWQYEKKMSEIFSSLTGLQNDKTQQSLLEANSAYKDALTLLALLISATLLLGVAVAYLVVRRTGRIERDLFHEKRQAEITLHAIGDAVITTDIKNRINYLNPIAESILNCQSKNVMQLPISSILQFYDRNKKPISLSSSVNAFQDAPVHLDKASILDLQHNREIAIDGSASLIHDEKGNIVGKVIIFRDVSEHRHLADMLTWQATHDPLTGLVNRREYEHLMGNLLSDAHTNHRLHAALYIDLDQFKIVNDTCGHVAGDMLLQQLTTILQKQIRGSDTIARLGGDEFGLLLESCTLKKAEKIAAELLKTIQEYRFTWKNYVFKVGASIGVVPIDINSESVARIMSNADSACYIAKDKGRNRIWVHHADDKEVEQRHGEMALTSLINQALENDEFTIYKQKIQPINSDKGTIYELLIRMNSGSDDVLLPMAFIPAAERYTIMPSIDRWMISSAFDILSKTTQNYNPKDMISINLSGQSLSQDNFLDFIVNELDRFDVEPERICFEITETAAIANWQRVSRFVSVLHGMGCKFALDDFGSGMSSFTYLRNFAVDYIKIDGSFVRNIDCDEVNREMVKAIHSLGQVMKIQTIAEYVESQEILDELSAIGIDFAQGFEIHHPEPL